MVISLKTSFRLSGEDNTMSGGIQWFTQMSLVQPLVICGPSGSGKSTLLKYLMDEFGDYFGFSVSHTTRKPRNGEVHGKDYYFVDRKEMEEAVNNGEFIEFVEFSGNIKKAVKNIQAQDRICILDIEIEGVKNIKKTDLNPRYVFIKPPSLSVLEERLRGRGTETEESIQRRLAKAKEEIKYGETPENFHLVLVNDSVKNTYKYLREFLIKDIEELKRIRNK
ncbi:guanylate kinase-like isoform X2 [Tachypleus tridentatus]|uniref:guanylate kinase-like isoform X2 n=2 Tax=Tachypleus tridentatus TaxID=6853 RepID=UPI003FD20AE8